MTLVTRLRCRGRDCGSVFLSRSNGHKFCDDCARKRKLEQNRRSQLAYEQKLPSEIQDLSDAVIDRVFTEALREIRRSGVHRVEAASWNYAGRYREP